MKVRFCRFCELPVTGRSRFCGSFCKDKFRESIRTEGEIERESNKLGDYFSLKPQSSYNHGYMRKKHIHQ